MCCHGQVQKWVWLGWGCAVESALVASACVGPQTSGTNSFNIKPGMRDSGRAVFCLVLFLGSFSTRVIPCKNTV